MTENKEHIDITQIMEMIPHRYPLLLIDRVLELEEGQSITAIKNVSFNEPHFTGHFPEHPVMPGVLIIEAMAQASAILAAKTMKITPEDKVVYFMSISGAKFRKIVTPGDTLYLKVQTLHNRGGAWKFKARAEVDGQLVAESEFSAMVRDK